MSAAYPGHIISDANCIGGWVGPRSGMEVVEKKLTPTPLRNVAVVLLHNPALPKQCSAEHRQELSEKSWSKLAYIKISNATKNVKCAPHMAEIFVWQLAILS